MCAIILRALMDFSFVLEDHNMDAVRASGFINTSWRARGAGILTSPLALGGRSRRRDVSK